MKKLAIAFLFMLVCSVSANLWAFELPDTGQTTCYNGSGSVITCPQPGQSLAQDGSY